MKYAPPPLLPEPLRGRECYAGLDLSRTRDMTAFVLGFPWPEYDAEAVVLWPTFWLPEKRAARVQDKVPMLDWAARGELRLTRGKMVDYDWVKADIRAMVRDNELQLKTLAYDPALANEITQQLVEGESSPDGETTADGLGVERVEFKQTILHFTAPSQEFDRRVEAGLILHPGNRVMTWQVGHVETVTDYNQNVRPVKPPRFTMKSVDGVVAAVMMLREVMVAERGPQILGAAAYPG